MRVQIEREVLMCAYDRASSLVKDALLALFPEDLKEVRNGDVISIYEGLSYAPSEYFIVILASKGRYIANLINKKTGIPKWSEAIVVKGTTLNYYDFSNLTSFLRTNDTRMDTITTTKEKVLEAASKCSVAKATLEILFPDVFKDSDPIVTSGTRLKYKDGDIYIVATASFGVTSGAYVGLISLLSGNRYENFVFHNLKEVKLSQLVGSSYIYFTVI